MTYSTDPKSSEKGLTSNASSAYPSESIRLEFVTTCVGFADILNETLPHNMSQVDTGIVVTSHDDKDTQEVAHRHNAICVQTDLFTKNGRKFNKGAAINAGFGRFQYYGWRMHLDSDILLPSTFRRMLFNHTHLDENSIYGIDRTDVVGKKELNELRTSHVYTPQAAYHYRVCSNSNRSVGSRYVDPLRGYVPLGAAQLWFATSQHSYPYSAENAAHSDIMFAEQWGSGHRKLLPTAFVYHLVPDAENIVGRNWEGRTSPKLK